VHGRIGRKRGGGGRGSDLSGVALIEVELVQLGGDGPNGGCVVRFSNKSCANDGSERVFTTVGDGPKEEGGCMKFGLSKGWL